MINEKGVDLVDSSISILACDIGAGSGRVLQGVYNGNHIDLTQVTRFGNGLIKMGNSLYWDILGIYREVKDRSYIFDIADKLLFIPDLLNYFLTGQVHSEYTLSTISQLYNYESCDWDYKLMERLGIPTRLFSPIVQPGTMCGSILPSICNDLHINSIPLIAVGAHDTASAIAAISEPEEQIVYISSGTWSIVGTETDAPVINDTAFKYNFSNEGGVGGKIRLIKNVMGM
ncbi:MAG TPA: FGGY family carbohydrate kinase [Ruminiclostridium sp.]